MHCIYYRIGLWRHHFTDGSDSKQLHEAPVLGEDTDVTYLHSCDLITKFDLTVSSLQFLPLNVVLGLLIFVSSLVERRSKYMLTARRRILYKLDGVRFLNSKESSVFFLWAKESVSLWNCFSRNLTLFSPRRRALGLFWMQPRQRRFGEFWRKITKCAPIGDGVILCWNLPYAQPIFQYLHKWIYDLVSVPRMDFFSIKFFKK